MSDNESVGDIENDLEIILEGDEQNYAEEEAGGVNVEENDGQENTQDETKKEVKPKRVVKNPQPKLNEQTLKGSRGLAAIETYFERVTFKGRGYEEQDLNILLKTYEYWCHRLFPKFPFDSCIERLEKLGTKRATQTQIKKIRMGLDFDFNENTELNEENTELNEEELSVTGGFVDTYNDQFDQLVSTSEPEPLPEITDELLARIQQNMEKAKKLREEKLKKIRKDTQNLDIHSQINTQDAETFASITNDQNSGSNDELQNSVKMQTDDDGGEEDINNILDYINSDDVENLKRSDKEFDVVDPTNETNNCSKEIKQQPDVSDECT